MKPPKQTVPWPVIIGVCGMIALLAFYANRNGNRAVPLKAMGDPNAGKVYYKYFDTSAYCVCRKCCGKFPDHPAYGITASGHRIQPGDCLIAAPKEYPFGTEMVVPGYADGRRVRVEDRGGAIKSGSIDPKTGKTGLDKIDLLFPSHQAAKNYGRKTVKVKVFIPEQKP